jgi:hypothetical protein
MKRAIDEVIEGWLEDYSLEELFEELNLDPADVLMKMYMSGQIDEDYLENFLGVDSVDNEE